MDKIKSILVRLFAKSKWPTWGDPKRSAMESYEYRLKLYREIAEILHTYGTANFKNFTFTIDDVVKLVEEFIGVFISDKRIVKNDGGSGFSNCLWLFFTVKVIKPELIVESGVWKGMTTYILEQAAPDADMYCFDVIFHRREYKNPKAHYIKADWSTHDFGTVDKEKSFAFFDCHINHAKRIREAYDRGFRHIIVDDNMPLHKLYSDGLPPIPTADMLLNENLEEGTTIKWTWDNIPMQYTFKTEDLYDAKDLVETCQVFPDLTNVTRFSSLSSGFSFLTYIKLRD